MSHLYEFFKSITSLTNSMWKTWLLVTKLDACTLCERCPNTKLLSPNVGKYGPEITPYLDTFHAVALLSSTILIMSSRSVLTKVRIGLLQVKKALGTSFKSIQFVIFKQRVLENLLHFWAFGEPKIQNCFFVRHHGTGTGFITVYWDHYKPPILSYSEVRTYVLFTWGGFQILLFIPLTETLRGLQKLIESWERN